MGSIVTRKRNDGTVGYSAQIVIKRKGVIIHRETKTFDRKAAAQTWMTRREAELSQPGAIEALKQADPPLSDVIDLYMKDTKRKPGKTKLQVLRTIKTMPIANMKCSTIDSTVLLDFAKSIKAKPQTVGNYMSHLASIFQIARPAWNMPLNAQAMDDARIVAKKLGIISKAIERERRPTLDEIDRLMGHFMGVLKKRPTSNPMPHIVAFAIFSTRRLEEITRIVWEDYDRDGKRVMVRDLKHPGEKIGNDTWCDLPEPAIAIIEAMPRTHPQIFPFGADAIGAAFTRACKFLAIEDLHFHDLRHDGVSRLFEMGYNIPQAAAVSGHRSWKSLQRYTHVRQVGDKYEGWKWMPVVTAPLPAVERKFMRGKKWYERMGHIVNPALEGRGRKPDRPRLSDQL